jgi:pimeloyl-ACP methyl ester carboxylesterase
LTGFLLIAGLLSSCAADTRPVAPMMLTPCHLERLAEEVLCGTHEVFEDRDALAGRRLSIHVAVMPALRRSAEPDPLFILAGGPGQGARSFAAAAARYFKKIRRTREIVLVDLRGTGASGALTCARPDDERSLSEGFFLDADAVARCRDGLAADPRRYTHINALADLDDIRQRLGYTRINLWGGSWGTRAALLYTITYPHAARTVVLDGAVSLAMEFPRSVAHDAQQAFERLLSRCAAEPGCAAAHAGARAGFEAVLTSLEAAERRAGKLVVATRHPRSGAILQAAVTRDMIAEIVRVALYTPGDAARVLQMIRHAAAGDFGPLIAQALRSASMTTDDMAIGQTLSVLCSEDMPLVSGLDFTRDGAGTFLGASYADGWRRRCEAWPLGKGLSSDRRATSPAPALILSGEHDPVTPPAAGEAMGLHFPSHLHIVVPGAAHNASFGGCVPELIAEFLARGSGVGLDAGCAARIAWPPAVISDAGTLP